MDPRTAQRRALLRRFLLLFLPAVAILALGGWWALTEDGVTPRAMLGTLAVVLLLLAVAAFAEARSTVARRSAEMILRRQLSMMARLGETISSPVFVKDRDGRYLAVNRAFEELLARPRERILRRTDREISPEDPVERYEQLDREALAGAEEVVFEAVVEAEGKAARQVEVHKKSFTDEQGEVAGLVGVVHDVTAIKAAQARLAESESRFRAIVEGNLDIILVLSAGARIRYANPRAERALGWSLAELAGRSVLGLVHADDLALARRTVTAMRENPALRPRFELRVGSRGGEWLELELWAARLEGASNRAGILVVGHDISARRRAQSELAESRARLQRVLEQMPVMLAAIGEQGRYVVWNRECERVTGYTFEEMSAAPVTEALAHLFPSAGERARVQKEWEDRLGAFRDWELELACKDSSRRVTAWSSIAREFPVQGWSTWSIAVDVTDRNRAERERAAAIETLQSWVAKLQRLNELDDVLHACRSLDEAYAVLQRALPPLFSAPTGALYRPEPGQDGLQGVVHWGDVSTGSLARDACWALRLGHTHLVDERGGSAACPHLPESFAGCSVCAPILAQGELLGLLHLRSAEQDPVPARRIEPELQLAQMVAGHLGLRLAALGLREALEYRSTRDPLTNLFNRRYLEETLERELASARRHGRSLALVMADLDHFKKINDTYGHGVGDAVLREVAAVLQRGLRTSDVASRWGGEEFLLLLPEADVPPATNRAEQLRQAVRRLAADGSPDLPAELSISAGVAIFPRHASTATELIRAADRALYRAKEAGRDRVRVAGDD